ncbi:MAG: tetratricopeptide repeat protein [archaeon]
MKGRMPAVYSVMVINILRTNGVILPEKVFEKQCYELGIIAYELNYEEIKPLAERLKKICNGITSPGAPERIYREMTKIQELPEDTIAIPLEKEEKNLIGTALIAIFEDENLQPAEGWGEQACKAVGGSTRDFPAAKLGALAVEVQKRVKGIIGSERAGAARRRVQNLVDEMSQLNECESAGNTLFERGGAPNFEKAQQFYDDALELAERVEKKLGSRRKISGINRKKAKVCARQNDRKGAKKAADAAWEVAKNTNDDFELAEVLITKAYTVERLGGEDRELERAEGYLKDAAGYLGKLKGNDLKQATADWHLIYGNICIALKRDADAIKHFRESEDLFKEFGNTEGLAKAYNNIGATYSYMQEGSDAEIIENLEKAIDWYKKAIDLREAEKKYLDFLPGNYVNLGSAYAEIARRIKGKESYTNIKNPLREAEKAYATAEKLMRDRKLQVLNVKAGIFRLGGTISALKGDWRNAKSGYEKAIALQLEGSTDRMFLGELYFSYGELWVMRAMGEFEVKPIEALESVFEDVLKKSISVYDDIGSEDKANLSRAMLAKGYEVVATKMLKARATDFTLTGKAKERLEKALELFERIKDSEGAERIRKSLKEL